MGTVKDTLDVARRELGTTESPFGSNKTKYGRAYGMDGYAWCMMFMWWVLEQTDSYDILKTAYTPTAADAYKKDGRWTTNPKPGDLVFFYWSSMGRIAHVGIVESVGNGYVNTIEGNTDESGGRTGGKVMRRRRSRGSSIPGFGRPKYSKSTPTSKTAPSERGTVVGLPINKGDKSDDVRYIQVLLRQRAGKKAVSLDKDYGPNVATVVGKVLQWDHGHNGRPVGSIGGQRLFQLQQSAFRHSDNGHWARGKNHPRGKHTHSADEVEGVG